MKKTIIAVAVAAASMASMAHADGTTLYGSVRLSYELNSSFDDNYSSDIANNSSRFGIKGTEDLGNGLHAFYRYEFGVDADKGSIGTGNTQRLAYAGIQSDSWGAISLGAQWSPYYNVVGYNDIFNGGFSYDRTYLGKFRLADVLAYTSPNWSGFQFQVALVADGEETAVSGGTSDDLDAYNISANYTNQGFYVGLSYLATNGLDDESQLVGGALGFSNDTFRIGLVGEFGSDYAFGGAATAFAPVGEDPYNISLAGEYYFGDTDLIRGIIEYIDYDSTSGLPDDAEHYAIGYQHNFSKRTRVWAEYSYFDVDDYDDELESLSIGLRTDF